ncbi:MAG: dihydrodipicolinate synthase family protein, partial [Candidatus Abyssobacteria bacterium SURF_17]
PQQGVGYSYTAYSQFPWPDLHRLDTRPYGLQTKPPRKDGKESDEKIVSLCLCAFVVKMPFSLPSVCSEKRSSGIISGEAEYSALGRRTRARIHEETALVVDSGIYVANLTAFKDGKLDVDAMRDHAEFLIKSGVAGLCPAGTTGEFLYLSAQEKKLIFLTLIAQCRGRSKILCCPWDANVDAMADLCRSVSDKGADGIFLPPPIYYEFTDTEIVDFYEFIRRNSGVPVYCYNIPKYSNNEIRIDALQAMVDRKLVGGIKDSSANEERLRTIISRFGDTLDILAGGDHFVLKAKTLGANGFISALGNIYPELFVALWNSPTEELQRKICTLRDGIKGYGGIPALKYLLSKRGYPCGCRFPFKELDDAQKRALDTLADSL